MFLPRYIMLPISGTEVSDEEAVAHRAINLLVALGLRTLPIPDCSHQQWGDYERAAKSAGIMSTVLKATLLCNAGSGPWTSGRNQFNARRAAELLVSQKDAKFFEELSDLIAYDRGLDEGSVEYSADDFLESPGIRTRLKKAGPD